MQEKDNKFMIYFAGPDVFSPDWAEFKKKLASRCLSEDVTPLFPADTPGWVSRRIVEDNLDKIRRANAIIANMMPFRGVEPDSGTTFEVGFAKALGKPVVCIMENPETIVDRVEKSVFGPITNHSTGWEIRDKDGFGVEGFGFPLNIMVSETSKFAASYEEAFEWISGVRGKRGSWQNEATCEGLLEYASGEAIHSEFVEFLRDNEVGSMMFEPLSKASLPIFRAIAWLRDAEELRRERGAFLWMCRMGWGEDASNMSPLNNLTKRIDMPEDIKATLWESFNIKSYPPSMRSFAEWWDRELLPNFVAPFVWGPSERLLAKEEEGARQDFLSSIDCLELDGTEGFDVFSVVRRGRKWAPKFQFDQDGKVIPGFQDMVKALGRRMTEWHKAFWMVSGNARLGGEKPSHCIHTSPDAVIAVALKESEPGFSEGAR